MDQFESILRVHQQEPFGRLTSHCFCLLLAAVAVAEPHLVVTLCTECERYVFRAAIVQ